MTDYTTPKGKLAYTREYKAICSAIAALRELDKEMMFEMYVDGLGAENAVFAAIAALNDLLKTNPELKVYD